MRDKSYATIVGLGVGAICLVGLLVFAAVQLFGGSEPPINDDPDDPYHSANASEPSTFVNGDISYNWEPVRVGAGGFVTGIETHAGGPVLIRTDTYGGYKFVDNNWEQIITTASMPAAEHNPDDASGIQALATSPSDPDRAYAFYANKIYSSKDGATTWQPTTFSKPANPNDELRLLNDKLAVKPDDPDVVLVGVPNEGLYRSADGGQNFSKIESVPISEPGAVGITFDTNKPEVAYLIAQGSGIFRTTDAGLTWSRLAGGPSNGTDIELGSDGRIYVAATPDDGERTIEAWVFANETWSDISPKGHKVLAASVAVATTNPDQVFLLTENGYLVHSNNGGTNWTSTENNVNRSALDIGWLQETDEEWMSASELVADNKGSLWFTQGSGVWTTKISDVDGGVTWKSRSRGIEQLVANDVISVPGQNDLTLAAWDRPLFSIADPKVYPKTHGPDLKFNNAWDIDWSATDPKWQAALISDRVADRGPLNPSFSTDGGKTWASFPTNPGGETNGLTWGLGGAIAVGEPGNVVIVPAQCVDETADETCAERAAYFTKDAGKTWDKTAGLPNNRGMFSNYYLGRKNLTADRVTAGTFYAYHSNDGVYRSTDGGANWSNISGGPVTENGGFNLTMKSVPDQAGHLYLSAGQLDEGAQPLYQSSNGGTTWQTVPDIERVYAFGFGKAAEGSEFATVFAAAWINETYGLYRSTDNGATWTQIGDYPSGWMDRPRAIDGDKQTFGKVYVAYGGSGWSFGEPN